MVCSWRTGVCGYGNKLTSTPTIDNAYTSVSFVGIRIYPLSPGKSCHKSSGAMYREDPLAHDVVNPRSSMILERPKSDNMGLPSSAIKTFAYGTDHENRSNERQTNSHP